MVQQKLSSEAYASAAIKDYLEHLEIMGKCSFNRANSGVIRIDKRVFRGARKGTADFECVFAPKGQHVSIEVKSEKGKQSEPQVEYQKKIERLGGVYILAKSIRDVEDKLKEKKII